MSSEEHNKGISVPPASKLNSLGYNFNASMEIYIARRIARLRDACAYRAVILLTSQRCGGMASMSGQYRFKSSQGCQRQCINLL